MAWVTLLVHDVIIFSTTWEQHLQHMDCVLQMICEAGLTIKKRKCQFAMSSCVYLGHRIGSGKVSPDDIKVKAIEQFSTPTSKKQVCSFLGLAGYYRKFIPQYATVAAPLSDLTRKTQPEVVKWSSECEAAFRSLKQSLCSPPVLRSPNFSEPFILQTDASDRGVGGVLSQKAGA